ncbi:MAG: carbohydrate ABC transporter permease [Thermomicrobiales bacterium]|nr:carbohydrate ABC transporter permease [Thermomicrobiales bacterium]
MPTTRNRLVVGIIYFVLGIWALFTLLPIYWIAVTSIKSAKAVQGARPTFIPWVDFTPTFDAFRSIFGTGGGYGVSGLGNLAMLARNSFVAAFCSALLAVILGSMAAYALTRFRYRRWRNNDIAFWIVAQRMFPPVALIVPFYILFNRLNLLDHLSTLIIVYTAGNLPLVVWLLRDYFADLPVEIEEAALVDGASRFGAFFRIALPLALPGLVIAFLFAFVFAWNEFLFALTLTLDKAKTLPLQLAGNISVQGTRYWDIAAQGLIVMLPPLLIALFLGRYLIRGLTMGAVK